MIYSDAKFTFMHLADAFIQSDLQCIQAIHLYCTVCTNSHEYILSSGSYLSILVIFFPLKGILCFYTKQCLYYSYYMNVSTFISNSYILSLKQVGIRNVIIRTFGIYYKNKIKMFSSFIISRNLHWM